MAKLILKVDSRQIVGKKVKKLRQTGVLPGTVFGKGIESVSIQVLDKDFGRLYREVGETGLIYLQVAGETVDRPVLVKSLQYDPRTDSRLHVDFHQVNLKEKVTANVPVEIIGESEIVKSGMASVNQNIQEIEVECLPTAIPESFIIDLSELKAIGDQVKVSDLKVDADIVIQTDPESVIVALAELQKEEEVAAPVAVEVEGATETPTTAESSEEGAKSE